MKRRKGRASYKFTEKKHSKRGMFFTGLAGVSLFMYLIFIYLSYQTGGTLSVYYGSFGFFAMMMAFVTLIGSFTTLKEEDSFALFPRLAIGMSVLSVLCWAGTYILGMMRG